MSLVSHDFVVAFLNVRYQCVGNIVCLNTATRVMLA